MNVFIKYLRRIIGTNRIINQNNALQNQLQLFDRKINEMYNAHLFNSTIINSNWLKDKSFSPGRWAVDYSCLYVLYRLLNEMKPNNIVEFGLGQSTKMFQQYSKAFNAKLISFESNLEWINFFKNSYQDLNTNEICHLETETRLYKGAEVVRFKEDFLNHIIDKLDFVFLDAPIGSKRYSRIQILDIIPEKINTENFCMLIDDSNRTGEQETIYEITEILNNNNIPFKTSEFRGETDQMLICSPNNLFLTSI